MAFANHDEGDAGNDSWFIRTTVNRFASVSQSWQFFFEHYFVLAFSYPIAIDENVLWQVLIISLLEVFQTRHKHLSKHPDHFMAATVDAKIRWPLRQTFVTACHHGSYTWSVVVSRPWVSHIYANHHGCIGENRTVGLIVEYVVDPSEFEINFLYHDDISIPLLNARLLPKLIWGVIDTAQGILALASLPALKVSM